MNVVELLDAPGERVSDDRAEPEDGGRDAAHRVENERFCFVLGLLVGVVESGLFWGGRLCVLPWLGVGPVLTTPWLKLGFTLLLAECAIYTGAYAWLALR